ncbi:IS4 family transposase, partial [Ralstonia solanacearum species complex bacterium KE056]
AHLLAKKPAPKGSVTLNQMIRLVASLGGFLGRKSDGEPGAKTIWIGLQRTMDAASMIQALRGNV